tara:strand:- start:257 stop:1282 length:1026 start_codon:yes stop_codon:yes gene_type:complete
MFKITILALVVVMSSQSHAYDMHVMIEKHLIPTYRNLAEHTNKLNITASKYCSNPRGVDRETMQRVANESFLAWQKAQHIRFGPVLAFSRDRRFEFWPDKRGTIRKQLYNLYNSSALSASDFDITQKSVAIQGFSALEQILYSKSEDNDAQCRLITKITGNLQTMANDILAEWTSGSSSYVELFLNPGQDNYLYRSEAELAGELINALYTQLEIIITRKLDLPLGSSIDEARGKRSEGWRSQSALMAISENLNACHEFYRYSFASQLVGQPLHQEIEMAFESSRTALGNIDVPLSQAVDNAEKRILVVRLKEQLSQLKKLLASDLTDTLEISLGFNSLDGD